MKKRNDKVLEDIRRGKGLSPIQTNTNIKIKKKNAWVVLLTHFGSMAKCGACKELVPYEWIRCEPFLFCPYCGIPKCGVKYEGEAIIHSEDNIVFK